MILWIKKDKENTPKACKKLLTPHSVKNILVSLVCPSLEKMSYLGKLQVLQAKRKVSSDYWLDCQEGNEKEKEGNTVDAFAW